MAKNVERATASRHSTRTRSVIQFGRLFVTLMLAACISPALGEDAFPAEYPPKYPPMPEGKPPALEVENASAKCEADMKPYAEQIAGMKATFDMVPILGGKFLMGSPADEAHRSDDEGPQIEVMIEPFWMGKHEVTWAEYHVYTGLIDLHLRKAGEVQPIEQDAWADAVTRPTEVIGPSKGPLPNVSDPRYPVTGMTQLATRQYCKWISMKTGRFYRLPTEAEWEYAARAGTTTAYSFGDDPDYVENHAWYFDNSENELGKGTYYPVGSKKPNPWGLYDMHGNVSERVIDQYAPDWYAQFSGKGVMNYRDVIHWPTTMYPRVVRGGSWDHDPDRLRSAARLAHRKPQGPQFSIWWHSDLGHIGFRLVRPLQEPSEEEKKRYWEPETNALREALERQHRSGRR